MISLQTKRFSEKTAGHCDITGIAPKVRPAIEKAHIHPALISALVAASSAALTTTKHESRSIQDLKEFVKRPIPSGRPITTTGCGDDDGFFCTSGPRLLVRTSSYLSKLAKSLWELGSK